MRKFYFFIFCLVSLQLHAQSNQWTWMGGDNTQYLPNYGQQGLSAASNNPGLREHASTWADGLGDLWFFGGTGSSNYYNDIWKYTKADGQWTWIAGTNL